MKAEHTGPRATIFATIIAVLGWSRVHFQLRLPGQLCYNCSMNKVGIRIPKAKLIEFSRRWNVSELALFGSVLRADFRPDSDVDVLVSFVPEAHITLFDMAKMQEELKEIFKRDVDLVSRHGLEHSRNYLRKKQILGSAQVIHVA